MNKKILIGLLTGIFAVSAFTACGKQSAEVQNPPENAFVTVNEPQKGYSENTSDIRTNERDLQKLHALQFDGYEKMTVSDFQNKIWEMTDTDEYRDYLQELSHDEDFCQMKDSDEDAYFMFYILEPLTAENWQSRNFGGYTMTDYPNASDNAMLEFSYTLTIKSADTLTVREYITTRLEILNGLQEILYDKTIKQLQNKTLMQEATDAKIETLKKQYSTDNLEIFIEYSYFPLSELNEENYNQKNTEQKSNSREYPNGTEEDYQSLLALKNLNYRDMVIADFNSLLLEWANEHYEQMERIYEDILCNDIQISLSDDDLAFVKWTVYLSGKENAKYIQSQHNGREEENPVCGEHLQTKEREENGMFAWCDLYYQFSYGISDKNSVTVGERDRQIENMINAVREFWENADIESILKMSESDIIKELEKIAETYSTDNVIITINSEQIHFECMDERGIIF